MHMHRRSEKEQGNFNTLKKGWQDFFAVPGRCAAAARDRHTYAAFAHNALRNRLFPDYFKNTARVMQRLVKIHDFSAWPCIAFRIRRPLA